MRYPVLTATLGCFAMAASAQGQLKHLVPARPTPQPSRAPAASAPAVDPDSPLGRAVAVHKAHLDKISQARQTLADAHTKLDEGDYEQAASLHRAAKAREAEAAELKREFDRQMEALVAEQVKGLNHDGYKVREAATWELTRMGLYAAPALAKALESASPEAKARLQAVLARLAGLTFDEKGRLHQWARAATASSEYGSNGAWTAAQATGEPDTLRDGDLPTAWASKEQDAGEEWLELTYDQAVRPTKVRVHETFNPGAVVKVEGKDDKGQWHTIWEGKDPTRQAPGYLEVEPKTPIAWPCCTIKVTLDSAAVPGWNEIDAVQLIGEPVGPIETTPAQPEKTSPAETLEAACEASARGEGPRGGP